MSTRQQFRQLLDFSFPVICVVLGLSTATSVHGGGVPKSGPTAPAIAPDRFNISGTVMNAPDLSQEAFDKLNVATADSEEEFILAFKSIFRPLPAPNVVVTALGKSVTEKAITDSKGQFEFPALPGGDYEVSAQISSHSAATRVATRLATAKEQVNLNRNCSVVLWLRADLVNIKGRIIDVHGKNVAGAKVTAIEIIDDQSYLENHEPRRLATVSSGEDGSYELQGLEPFNFYVLGGCLQAKPSNALEDVIIHVEADGFISGEAKVLRVTEEQIEPARRLLKVYSQMSERNGGPEYRERDGISFPSSNGNTITGIDIVLKKAGDAENQDGK